MTREENLKDSEIRIGNKIVAGKRGLVPIDSLHLDTDNIRLKHRTGITEADLEKEIKKDGGIATLRRDIEYTGGLRENIIADFKYIVKEGNRRLVSYRELRDQAKTDEERKKWEKIDTFILPPNTPVKDIALYLAIIHVVRGKKKWRTFNQASYVYTLRSDYDMSYDELSNTLGVAKATLIRMVKAYEATDRYSKKYPHDKEWAGKYSYFYEFFKNYMDIWNKDEIWLNKTIKWVGEGRIKKGMDIRLLPGILSYPELLKRFETDNVEHAIDNACEDLAAKDPLKADSSYRSYERTKRRLNDLSRFDLEVIARNEAKFHILLELKHSLDKTIEEIKKIKSQMEVSK